MLWHQPQLHQFLERRRLEAEQADGQAGVLDRRGAGDRLEARPILDLGVDHRRALVDAPAERVEHPPDRLEQFIVVVEDDVLLQVLPPAAVSVDARRAVADDGLDRRVVHQPLQRAQAGDPVVDRLHRRRWVPERRQVLALCGAALIVADLGPDQLADALEVFGQRIDHPGFLEEGADLLAGLVADPPDRLAFTLRRGHLSCPDLDWPVPRPHQRHHGILPLALCIRRLAPFAAPRTAARSLPCLQGARQRRAAPVASGCPI